MLDVLRQPDGTVVHLTERPVALGKAELEVDWELLSSFEYDQPEPEALADKTDAELAQRNRELFPPPVRALDGRRVAIRGHIVPAEIRRVAKA